MQQEIKKIRTASRVGLIGSAVMVATALLFHYLSPYQFYPNRYTLQLLSISGSVLALLVMLAMMMVIRKQIPAIRQMDAPADVRLRRYAERVASVYYTVFGVVAVLSFVVVLTNVFTMLMLVMVLMQLLVLIFPNMYRIKVDAGLDSATMRQLFGDKYPADEN